MSTTNWLILDVDVNPNNKKDPDGQVQLTYSIVNGVLQGSAVLSFRPNSNANGRTLFTTPSTLTANGVSQGGKTVYSLFSFSVPQFNLPAGSVYQGGQYDYVNGLIVTVASDGTATLSGKFSDPDGDTSCDWTADANAPGAQAKSHHGAHGTGAKA
jgi:hypothetical protein